MTVDRTNPYAVLGLTPQATQEEIRRAYRTLMRQNHPDTRALRDAASSAASNTKLHQATAAYTTLSDPASRAEYDHGTTDERTITPTHVDPAVRSPRSPRDQPPIQAGPVHWHPSPR